MESHEFSDLEFVLAPQASSEGVERGGSEVVIPAHRVIVAGRCEWFRRALQSGMKEAIDR